MRRRFFPRDLTAPLVALCQLVFAATLALILARQGAPARDPLGQAVFIVSILGFGIASVAVARASFGVHRAVFGGVALLALLGASALALGLRDAGATWYEPTALERAVVVGAMSMLLALYGGWALSLERSTTLALTQRVTAERELSATLEHSVAERTSELVDTQKVLQRMWWLGQQMALELHPQRVLERFMEVLLDIAQADGGSVGLLRDDGRVHIVAVSGIWGPALGQELPVVGSAMGRAVVSGQRWSVADAREHVAELYPPAYQPVSDAVRALAILPIARRGERIGAVSVTRLKAGEFTASTLDRIEAMADLLAVALENAELVDSLKQTEWRFRTLFRAAPDAVFTVLRSGRVREANDAVRDVVGVDPIQVVGRTLGDLLVPEDRPELEAALERTFNGSPSRLEVRMPGSGTTTPRLVSFAASRLPEADPPSVLIVGRDITVERDMRARLMESDRLAAVGELVAGVAHEVNNPLSSISAFAQLMLRDPELSPSQRESIDVIRAETLRASQVVKDLLAFARRSETQNEPLDINGVIARTLRMRTYQLNSARVEVEQRLGTDLPSVMGDARQLQQVCLNLLTNAVQAMEPLGGGTLTVTTGADGGNVTLELRDTGSGIPPEARVRIFEPFFTTKQEGEGTGLGLSVSYGIVSAHGGAIEVVDTSDRGTAFRVTLPAAEVPPREGSARESGPFTVRSPLAGLRLLFVDDEPALRSGMEAYGAMRGFTVYTAFDGESALAVLQGTSVDAVVCDLRMPGMDGFTLHERLRKERPGLAARTVFITGDVVSTGVRSSNPASRQPLLTKPFSFEKLEDAVVAVMRGGSASRPRSFV
ncbi:MAG: ATP-binding protein [Gemmatimonadaceae bacterium]